MNAHARRLAQLEAVEAARARARLAAMTDAELEAEAARHPAPAWWADALAAMSEEQLAALLRMTDAELMAAVEAHQPADEVTP